MNRLLRKQTTRSQCRSRLSSLTSLSSHISTGKLEAFVFAAVGNGFLSSKYQGDRFFRAGAEPVLYPEDPPGISRESRRRMLDSLAQLNKMWFAPNGDPEIETRITQYEMAYRMQTSGRVSCSCLGLPLDTFLLTEGVQWST